MLEAAGFGNLQIAVEPEISLTDDQWKYLNDLLDELKTGKPLQYVLGETEFYGLKFKVNTNVLIPRQETEELVDLIIKENDNKRAIILDIGTGSGCIAVTLARRLMRSEVFATDISEPALEIAKINAGMNNVNVQFIPDNILNPEYKWNRKYFDIIVSNPPYVVADDIKYMQPNVLNFEPSQALFADPADPMLFYRKIFDFARIHLRPGGKIYFEMNERHGSDIKNIAGSYIPGNIEIIKDINGKDRIFKFILAS